MSVVTVTEQLQRIVSYQVNPYIQYTLTVRRLCVESKVFDTVQCCGVIHLKGTLE